MVNKRLIRKIAGGKYLDATGLSGMDR